MTYVPCSSCGSACGPNHQDDAFDPTQSRTAQIVTCSSSKCRCGSPHCTCSESHQCVYTRSYAEESSSSGILVEDYMYLHDGGSGAQIVFGCETHETGEIFKQRADGLLGLGNSDSSVINQLVAQNEIEDVFSLCFGLVDGDGVLMIGDSPAAREIELEYTPLVPSPLHPFYYNVQLNAISVAGTPLNVPAGIFQEGYAVVLDSGTTFSYVPTPVFRAFAEAVEKHALARGLRRVRGPDPQYDDVCFGGGPEHTEEEALLSVFPSFALHFASDLTLMLGPLNYLFVHTFNSGKYCLGIFDNGKSGTLLGGVTFRNIMVQYDRRNRRVGFGRAACKDIGRRYRPPCSAFVSNDNDELSAVMAVADGDCEPEEPIEIKNDILEKSDLSPNAKALDKDQPDSKYHGEDDSSIDDMGNEEMVMPLHPEDRETSSPSGIVKEEPEDVFDVHGSEPDNIDSDIDPDDNASVIQQVYDALMDEEVIGDENVWKDEFEDNQRHVKHLSFGKIVYIVGMALSFLAVLAVLLAVLSSPIREASRSSVQNFLKKYQPLNNHDPDTEGGPGRKINIGNVDKLGTFEDASDIEMVKTSCSGSNKKSSASINSKSPRLIPSLLRENSNGQSQLERSTIIGKDKKVFNNVEEHRIKKSPSEATAVSLVNLRPLTSSGPSGEMRKGLTTPQKLQRTNSNSAAASAATLAGMSAYAEESSIGSGGHHTPKSGGRPSTPTRL